MRPLTITLMQQELAWEDPETNRNRFRALIESLEKPTQLVVLPEMFTTGFSMQPERWAESMDGPSVQWMKTVAAKNRIILTGSLMVKERDHYYNRMIWMLPNGSYGHYDKRHLFGYAGEDEHYAPGQKRVIASVNGWKVNLQVCYDLRFPVWARNRMIEDEDGNTGPEYDLLLYVANWPERRSTAWKTLLQARAIENQCFVAGVNRVGNDGNNVYHSGNSMLVDPLGEIVHHVADKPDVSTFTLQPQKLEEVRSKLPFLKDQDYFSMEL
jgi:omega-amidase